MENKNYKDYPTYILEQGNKKYNDYPTYILEKGKKYADERRKLYKLRHEDDRNIKNSRGFYADKILW